MTKGIVIRVKVHDTTDRTNGDLEWQLPVTESMLIQSMELLANGQPVILFPFAMHGRGYHTICRRVGDEIDTVDI